MRSLVAGVAQAGRQRRYGPGHRSREPFVSPGLQLGRRLLHRPPVQAAQDETAHCRHQQAPQSGPAGHAQGQTGHPDPG